MKKIIIINATGNYLIEIPFFGKIKWKKLPTSKIKGCKVDLVMVDELVKSK